MGGRRDIAGERGTFDRVDLGAGLVGGVSLDVNTGAARIFADGRIASQSYANLAAVQVGGMEVISPFRVLKGTDIEVPGVRRLARVPVTFADFAAAALTADVDLPALSATKDAVIIDAFLRTGTAWSGGAVASASMTIGRSGDTTVFVASGVDLTVGASYFGTASGDKGSELSSPQTSLLLAGAQPRARVTTSGANTDQLTAGTATIYLAYYLLP